MDNVSKLKTANVWYIHRSDILVHVNTYKHHLNVQAYWRKHRYLGLLLLPQYYFRALWEIQVQWVNQGLLGQKVEMVWLDKLDNKAQMVNRFETWLPYV